MRKAAAYCATEFGRTVAYDFLDSVDRQVNLLAEFPEIGKVEPLLKDRKLVYRSLVVHKFFKLIYYVNEKKQRIVIADLWDTRREPTAQAARIKH